MTRENKITIYKIAVAAILYVLSLLMKNGLPVAVAAYIVVGYDVLYRALKKLLCGHAMDENFLMSIASVGAFCIGEVHEGIFVILFYKVGQLFEEMAVVRSRRSITALLEKMPEKVCVLRDGAEVVMEPDMVKVGDEIIIRPGERVAVDGVILDGFAAMDTASLTGESAPREYGIGDEVVSGFINLNGHVRVRATKIFEDSTAYKILELVENATLHKAKTENFITKFAAVYTPIVVALAAGIAILPPLFVGMDSFTVWLHRAFVFLVVSCPCALVISVPLGFFGGIGKASRSGILIKGSNYLEILSRVRAVAFDKTGTLTTGQFHIAKVETNGWEKDAFMQMVTTVEHNSKHALAVAICSGEDNSEKNVTEFEEISGLGIRAVYDGHAVLCGSRRFMENQEIRDLPKAVESTCVYVAVDGTYAGRILLEDTLRPEAICSVEALRKHGVQQIVLLTGDTADNAQKVEAALGLDAVYTELLPQDKVLKMGEYASKGAVAFVGDGINDAPVLASADIGIAMGAFGSDVAIETADVVLLKDSVCGVVDVLKISKQTMRIVKQNILFALTVKFLILLFGALGIAGMWAAVFADVGVSVLAILNAMRLMFTDK